MPTYDLWLYIRDAEILYKWIMLLLYEEMPSTRNNWVLDPNLQDLFSMFGKIKMILMVPCNWDQLWYFRWKTYVGCQDLSIKHTMLSMPWLLAVEQKYIPSNMTKICKTYHRIQVGNTDFSFGVIACKFENHKHLTNIFCLHFWH